MTACSLPTDLPVSLPSQLVEQRPDVRAAEAQFHAASANLGVAIANQLPQFTITGSVGTEALGFTNLFTPATGVWSIAGGITQTLFDAGTLLHKKRAAAAALDQAAAQYRGTVITAFQNVADALRALQSDAETLHEQAAAEQAGVATAWRWPASNSGRRDQLPEPAERRPHLAAGPPGAGPGGGRPVRRHRRAVPGAGRRLVAS